MPKKSSTPVKASRKVAVKEDEEDEEEVVVVTSKKKTSAPLTKSAKNGKIATKTATPARKSSKSADEDDTYVPNQNSMRDFIMRSMKKGGSAAEIKKRAARFAEKKGVDAMADAKAYKNFDVAFYAKFLKGRGYDVDIDEENDSYTLSA